MDEKDYYGMKIYAHSVCGGSGSGCGCSASVFAGRLLKDMERGKYKRLLLMSTGALLSTISPLQGESIPGIAHAVSLEVE